MSTVDYSGIYWAGSLPRTRANTDPHDPAAGEALTAMLDWTGGELLDLTGGELRELQIDWARPFCDVVAHAIGVPDFKPGKGLKYADYMGRILAGLTIRRGALRRRVAEGALPEFPYAGWAREDRAVHDKLDAGSGTRPPFMAGIPTPHAIRLFSGALGVSGAPFENAMSADVTTILREHPDTVVQFEVPVEIGLASFSRLVLPGPLLRRRIAGLLAPLERIVREAPAGSAFAFHLCYGDLGRKPFVPKPLQSSAVMAEFVNAITAMPVWRTDESDGHARLFAIHDPWADGTNVLTDPERQLASRARAYQRIRPFPDSETIYAAGGLGPGLDVASAERFARFIASTLDGKVRRLALATPCGNGRTPPEEAHRVYDDARQALVRLRENP